MSARMAYRPLQRVNVPTVAEPTRELAILRRMIWATLLAGIAAIAWVAWLGLHA